MHRDIKPSNVLIDMEGRIKVADFGLAKLSDKNLNFGLTQTGMALGTPDYVAPESLMPGSDVDGRADIYAVGVMLYQMLTGDIPRGMFKMPSQKFQSIDPRFDAIIRRALEHDREERYQSSLELRLALDVILTTPRAEPGQESSAALPQQQPHTPGRTVVPASRNPGSSQQRIAPKYEPYEPPPQAAPTSTLPYLFAALLILGIGAWLIINNQSPTAPSNPPETTETTTVTPPPAPEPKIATKSGSKPPPPTPPGPPPPVKSAPASSKTPAMSPGTPVPPTPPATAHESIQSRLSQLESQFQSALERDVNAPYTEQLSALGAGYLTALERAIQDASKAARLDEALALREEKQRFTTHKFVPSIDPVSLHKSVVNLRNTFRSAEKKYAQQKDAAILPRYDRYIEVLNTLEQEVLTQGHSTDATAVRTKRDDIIARRKQSVAKLSSGA